MEYQRKQYRFGTGVGPRITTVPTTIGQYKPAEKKIKRDPNKRKENSFSIFFITINTNKNYAVNKMVSQRDIDAEKLRDALDNLFGSDPGAGGNCDFLEFFKLVPGQYKVYEKDDQDYEFWCSQFKELWIKGTTEWSNKYDGRRILHAHAIVKVVHSTRIHLNKEAIAEYIKAAMGMKYLPYIHIDMVNSSFYEILNYIRKDVDEPEESIKPENITDEVMGQLVSKMENLSTKKYK